jgi:2-(1,2-epoxy-1,2-dihydrophenyl)acetyl-CoA isomerase
MDDGIQFNIEDGIATITLNRPTKFNSVNRDLALSFQKFLDRCAKEEDIKVVVITGKGRAFCAGQDLGEIVDPNGPDISKIIQEHFNPIVRRIRHLEKPVIAAVNGVAAGAGANLAIVCDVVIATKSASFLQAFSAINLIPDSGGTYTLPRLIGWQKASALMMLGDKISATEAERIGMIYKVVPNEVFQSSVNMIAQKLKELPAMGLKLTKKALNSSFTNNFEDQLEIEDQLQTIAGHTDDYHEAVQAFIEKRKPVFTGK